jgi:hypothetical protein
MTPIGEILEDVNEVLVKGKYYYFPQFSDTRLYIKKEIEN